VIVDIGGVLAHSSSDVIGTWSRTIGYTPQELLNAIYGGNDDKVLVGAMSEDDWWRVVSERLPTADARELRGELEASQRWDDDLVALLRELQGSTRTAILSNAWPSQRMRLATAGLDDLVDEVLLSCEIGVAKPDPAAFQLALDRLGCAPRDTLLVDDTPGHVEVAIALGMHGHAHTDTPTTVDVIRMFVLEADRR
jgi:putative hydrolase of the HAD superfamily